MKHYGSISSFADLRVAELRRVRREIVSSFPPGYSVSYMELAELVEASPCSRFWVSPERAASVVIPMLLSDDVRGRSLKGMHAAKRDMFMEIFRRLRSMTRKYPQKDPRLLLVDIIDSPAPRFYLSAHRTRRLLGARP